MSVCVCMCVRVCVCVCVRVRVCVSDGVYVCVYTVIREIFVRDNLVIKFIRCVIFSWVSCTHENILPSNIE